MVECANDLKENKKLVVSIMRKLGSYFFNYFIVNVIKCADYML